MPTKAYKVLDPVAPHSGERAKTLVLQGHTGWIRPPDGGIFLLTGLVNFDPNTGELLIHVGGTKDICAQLV